MLVDPYSARVLQSIDATAQGRGTRIVQALYPLHAAMVGGGVVVAVAVVGAMGLAWLSWSGMASYVLAWLARRRVPWSHRADAARRPGVTAAAKPPTRG